ncbi:MAG: DUF1638 domain-containing protein [Betaproteobacteria bacterium]|nr:DUF1638 domain-containing protein [Betaproteobacteria bacterium]
MVKPGFRRPVRNKNEARGPRPDTLFIACSALGKEVRTIIQKYGWHADFIPLDSRYHLYPMKIEEAVEKCLNDTDGDGYGRRVVVYGHCGAHNLDAILANHAGAVRPVWPHCYEMYCGEDFRTAVKEVPGTYILTDYLVHAWDKLIVRGLKLDKHPKLTKVMFAHYKRMIYYAQEESESLIDKARAIAGSLGLELEVRAVGYGALEPRIVAIMAGRPQPGADGEAADYVYPIAAGPARQ